MRNSMVCIRQDALHMAAPGARYAINFVPGIRIDVPAFRDTSGGYAISDTGKAWTVDGDRIVISFVKQHIRIPGRKTGRGTA